MLHERKDLLYRSKKANAKNVVVSELIPHKILFHEVFYPLTR
jgi:hypothetical protein